MLNQFRQWSYNLLAQLSLVTAAPARSNRALTGQPAQARPGPSSSAAGPVQPDRSNTSGLAD